MSVLVKSAILGMHCFSFNLTSIASVTKLHFQSALAHSHHVKYSHEENWVYSLWYWWNRHYVVITATKACSFLLFKQVIWAAGC